MITTAWNNLFATDDLLPESDVNVVCNDNVVDLSSGWTVNTNSKEDISNIQSFLKSNGSIERNTSKIATLEWNFWALDGSFRVADNNTVVNRYISSEVCDENCEFSNPPEIYFGNRQPSSLKYLTVKFAPQLSEWGTVVVANRYKTYEIPEYDSDYVILDDLTTPQGVSSISISKWSMPFRRARLSEFLIGVRIYFDRTMISKFTHERSTDMVCAELPQNDVNLSVIDIENDWDINNQNAKYVDLVNTNTVFKIYYGYKVNNSWSYYLIDTVILKSLNRPANGLEANFILESDINRAKQTFLESENKNWTSYNQLLSYIRQKTGFTIGQSNIRFDYITEVREYLYRPFMTKLDDYNKISEYFERPMNEWMQLFGATMNAYIKRDAAGNYYYVGLLNFSNGNFVSSTAVDSISLVNCFEYPEIETLEKLGKISVATAPFLGASNPDSDITVQVQMNSSGLAPRPMTAKRYRYTVTYNNGNGKELQSTNHLICVSNNAPVSNPFGFEEELQIPQKYIRYLYKFLSEAKKITVKCRMNPAWQVGDLISMELRDGTIAKGYIIEINIEYAGYPKGSVTILEPKDLNI